MEWPKGEECLSLPVSTSLHSSPCLRVFVVEIPPEFPLSALGGLAVRITGRYGTTRG